MSVSPGSSAPRNHSPAAHSPPSRPTSTPVPAVAPSPLLLSTSEQELRRPSIQFASHKNSQLPRGSPKRDKPKRRISSPPPPPVFQPRVSFDTFSQTVDFIEENSFTLVTKHKDYEYTKRSRTFLCGCDDNDYSEYALQWLIDELVDDGDEIVCLRVVEKDDTIAGERSVEKGRYRSQAEDLMKTIQNKNHENKAINLVLEFAVGKVNKVIDEMINLYEPAILVVGTRGRSLGGFQGLLPGSVSKYCLQHSPVPVIVIRPSSKRDKARSKRALDPNRHAYKDLLEKSGPLLDADGHIFNAEDSRQASEDEAAAVAAAIGYKPARTKGISPLAKRQSTASEVSVGPNYMDDLKSPGIMMKSPELQNLDSPDLTDESSSGDEGNGVILKDKDGPDENEAPPALQAGVATNVMDTALGAILNKKKRTTSKSPARNARNKSKSPARPPVATEAAPEPAAETTPEAAAEAATVSASEPTPEASVDTAPEATAEATSEADTELAPEDKTEEELRKTPEESPAS
ncbi:hypothetical protein CC80DRAFT_489797 [Byssothecium circinans]|uniref:UspA domain-containing protein n=1 Tax=Byssothecium circinans TaxID=147558 RepID=A0A6A5U5U1_9PLEO|nr:hypothetical protein CC80DRAFT_489797 [Byssothecium circinans]